MDKERVLQEIEALKEVAPSVASDLDEGVVALERWPFPPGWEPSTGAIVYDLPNTYPREQPDAYIPEEMRFHGEQPLIMMWAGPPGWSKHCIHDMRDKWVPEFHSMITMTRMINKSLTKPNHKDPWEGADLSHPPWLESSG